MELHYIQSYRIAGKFAEDFNLAVWRIIKKRQIKFPPIIKHDAIRIVCIGHSKLIHCYPLHRKLEGMRAGGSLFIIHYQRL